MTETKTLLEMLQRLQRNGVFLEITESEDRHSWRVNLLELHKQNFITLSIWRYAGETELGRIVANILESMESQGYTCILKSPGKSVSGWRVIFTSGEISGTGEADSLFLAVVEAANNALETDLSRGAA